MSDGVFWPEFRAWLLEHDIDPDDCYEVDVCWTIESIHGGRQWDGPVRMEVDLWKRDEHGQRYTTPDGEVAAEIRMVPMRRLPAVEVVRYRPGSGGEDDRRGGR